MIATFTLNVHGEPPPGHLHDLPGSVTAGLLGEAAYAGAATPMATIGTLQAAPRATERLETC